MSTDSVGQCYLDLVEAGRSGDYNKVVECISSGLIDINNTKWAEPFLSRLSCESGDTPLMAIVRGEENDLTQSFCNDVVNTFVKSGADVNVRSNADVCALDVSLSHRVRTDYTRPLSFLYATSLIQAGADVNAYDKSGTTPLMCVCVSRLTNLAGMMLRAGADVNATCERGFTALHNACVYSDLATAQLLVESNAALEAVTCYGDTPLASAAINGALPVVEYLAAHSANVNAIGSEGRSVLQTAVANEMTDLVQVLIQLKADVNYIDNSVFRYRRSKRALAIAMAIEHPEIIELLTNAGAKC